MKSLAPVVGLAAGLCLFVAPSALAASASRSGDVITVIGTSSTERFYVKEGPSSGDKHVTVSEDAGMTPGGGCVQGYPGSPTSPYVSCGAGVTKVIVNAGDGDDLVFTGFNLTTELMEFNGEGGRDDLRGGPANDLLNGGSGNDTQLLGDKGNDVINGGDGDDVRILGDSDLTQTSDYGADVINGGAGIDTLDEQRNRDRAQFWSLDGIANDGTDRDDNKANGAEEGDNVMPDVENVTTGYDDDVIIGSAVANKINAGSIGSDVVAGLGGNDDITNTGNSSDADATDGGDGDDKIFGNKAVRGGAGNDTITSGGSDDQIDGGTGADSILAGDGNDNVQAVDGQVDQIGCGPGGDIANADPSDVINTTDNGQICETITRSSPPAGAPGQPFNPFGAPAGLKAGSGAAVAATQSLKTGAVGGSFRNVYNGSTVVATVTGNSAVVGISKIVVLGKQTRRNIKRGKVALKVRLSAKAKRALAKRLKTRRSVRLKISIRVTPPKASRGKTAHIDQVGLDQEVGGALAGSSPSTPAAARAASSSSCGACPASAITAPSSAPTNASATALAGGPGWDRPRPARPALIRRAQRLTSASEIRSSSRPTGWS